MPKICYKDHNFRSGTLEMINLTNQIIEEYQEMDLQLTLRQIYYQFVARDWFPEDRRWTRLPSGKWIRDPKGTNTEKREALIDRQAIHRGRLEWISENWREVIRFIEDNE